MDIRNKLMWNRRHEEGRDQGASRTAALLPLWLWLCIFTKTKHFFCLLPKVEVLCEPAQGTKWVFSTYNLLPSMFHLLLVSVSLCCQVPLLDTHMISFDSLSGSSFAMVYFYMNWFPEWLVGFKSTTTPLHFNVYLKGLMMLLLSSVMFLCKSAHECSNNTK